MSLTALHIGGVKIPDLSILRGMKLQCLDIPGCGVTRLAPLATMPLKELYCGPNALEDISPLKGMPLTRLNLEGTQISDLSVLRGKRLEYLVIADCGVTDVAPLAGLPLAEVHFTDSATLKNVESLRSIPTLKIINNLFAADFWKRFDAAKSTKAPPQ